MEGTAPELGPDGEPYFALPPPRKKSLWPWIAGVIVMLLVGLGMFVSLSAREGRSYTSSEPGESDPIREFVPEFPSVALIEGLLDPPVEVPGTGALRRMTALLPDPAGAPALLVGEDGAYEWRSRAGDSGRPFRTERALKHIRATGRADVPYVAITRVPGARAPETVVGLAADGSTKWSWQGEKVRFLQWIAPAFGANGEVEGCVVAAGGEDGMVGLKADGAVSWRLPRRHVMYEVSTHRDLPGWVASATGDLGVERIQSDTVAEGHAKYGTAALGLGHVFVTSVVLFPGAVVLSPGASGAPSVVLAGTVQPLPDQEPLVARVDVPPADARSAWRARPATEPADLVLLEAPGRPRLFAVTTKGGELLLLDESGGLRARVKLPGSEPGRQLYTYTLCAGRLHDGWAVVVRLLHGTYVYGVHPEKLPAK